MANASQCDLFQLGQMTRFFAMRTKTIFLGSDLTDPEFSLDVANGDKEGTGREERASALPSSHIPSTDVITILASLKQYPDYQIDSHHGSCGVRRRLIPIIPCIEKYLVDPRALLGINIGSWGQPLARNSERWLRGRRDHIVDIRLSQIVAIRFPGTQSTGPISAEEDAALLFTAKKRNWEA